MGRAARSNPRSLEGRKPPKYVSFQRILRAVRSFGPDRRGFEAWVQKRGLQGHALVAVERIWSELHPAPLVTLHESIPEPEKQTRRLAVVGRTWPHGLTAP